MHPWPERSHLYSSSKKVPLRFHCSHQYLLVFHVHFYFPATISFLGVIHKPLNQTIVCKGIEKTVQRTSPSYSHREKFLIPLFRYLLSRNMIRASPKYCIVGNFLYHSKFFNLCCEIFSIISPEFCFYGGYFWPFVARMNWGCGSILFLLSRGTPNSATSTSILPHLITMSVMNLECSRVSLCTQVFLFFQQHNQTKVLSTQAAFQLLNVSYLWNFFWPIFHLRVVFTGLYKGSYSHSPIFKSLPPSPFPSY